MWALLLEWTARVLQMVLSVVDLVTPLLIEGVKDGALHVYCFEFITALGVLSVWVGTHLAVIACKCLEALTCMPLMVVLAVSVAFVVVRIGLWHTDSMCLSATIHIDFLLLLTESEVTLLTLWSHVWEGAHALALAVLLSL